jgi:uncharacterized membrane protein YgaE (UPF0421/DUF939 family)
MGTPNRSGGSQFLHDLMTVDWSKVDPYGAVKAATLIAPLIVIGLFTGHEPSLVVLGGAFVLVFDLMLPPGPRTRLMLSVSVIFAAAFAIGMLISMANDYVVAPLLALGLFFITYLKVYPRAFLPLVYTGVFFLIGIINQNSTLTATGIGSLEVLIGGLWAILLTAIFPSRKFFKRQTTDQSVQEHQQQQQQQSQAKLIKQDRFKPFTSNLSIHSKYFQYALAFAITSAIGLLITQWFNLPEPAWVLATIFAILMPLTDIYVGIGRGVHRIIGTIIGGIIAILIIGSTENEVLLSLLLLLFSGIYVYVAGTKNYAFRMLFVTVMVLLAIDIPNPSSDLMSPLIRFESIIIGALLSFLTLFVFWIIPKTRSNYASRKVG